MLRARAKATNSGGRSEWHVEEKRTIGRTRGIEKEWHDVGGGERVDMTWRGEEGWCGEEKRWHGIERNSGHIFTVEERE